MKTAGRHISVFEHGKLVVGKQYNGVVFSSHYFDSLQRYHTETNGLYFDLGFQNIKFKEYVGVIQVGDLIIEVLPKADNRPESQEVTQEWKKQLIDMLRAVGVFDIQAPSSSTLQLKSNSILELYFELYLNELEYLLHRGLFKKYRKCEGNLYALKGTLLFQKHIQYNLVHQERSFVKYTVYDTQHGLHSILYKALRLLGQINHLTTLQSRIGALLLHFPEMPDIKVSENLFLKQTLNRKTIQYQRALQIARMLLLNYHPDISKGGHHVLALMFDMNMLWEQFVLVSLRKGFRRQETNIQILAQHTKEFWKPDFGRTTTMRPDIFIETPYHGIVVLDTKWKNLGNSKPSPSDLQQMYVYHHYYGAKKVALIYPGLSRVAGTFLKTNEQELNKECTLMGLEPKGNIEMWQKDIFAEVKKWIHNG